MTTAVIGVGNIGRAVASDIVNGGGSVVLAAHSRARAEQLAEELGESATVADVVDAVAQADVVIFAVWLDSMKELVTELATSLEGKIVIDPSNPIAAGPDGQFARTLPDDVSAASQIAALLPASASLVKAFGTLAAPSLTVESNRSPDRAVLFYAADDAAAGAEVSKLIATAGFEPMSVGGLDQAVRIEMFGDLHQAGGLQGRVLAADEAGAAVAAGRR